MTKNVRNIRRKILAWHKVIGLIVGLPMIFTVVTGVLLQYPQLLGPATEITTAVVIDPQQATHWMRGSNFGLHHSFDQGLTWQEAPLMWSPGSIRRLVFSPTNPSQVYALGTDALLVSEDSGRIWELLEMRTSEKQTWEQLIDLSVEDDASLLVLTDIGFLRSPDLGQTWFAQNLNSGNSQSSAVTLVHNLHTGHWLEIAGPWSITATAVGGVLLVFSGFSLVMIKRKNGRKQNA